MTEASHNKESIVGIIRDMARLLGRSPSRREFQSSSGLTEYQVLKHFASWNEAIRAAGLQPDSSNKPIHSVALLEDWGKLVRLQRSIPTRNQYRRAGKYSPGTFEKKFGPWSTIPTQFRTFAQSRPEWADVIALMPVESKQHLTAEFQNHEVTQLPTDIKHHHSKLANRLTYGNPIDFRGLRHEPVNEQGVVFLFGMVARELGYHVEVIQAAYPDCEAKRQMAPGKWQRVRIEFEYESRNFRDHGHPPDQCDLIVCWRHNWKECPSQLEVIELRWIIKTLASVEE